MNGNIRMVFANTSVQMAEIQAEALGVMHCCDVMISAWLSILVSIATPIAQYQTIACSNGDIMFYFRNLQSSLIATCYYFPHCPKAPHFNMWC